VNDKDLGFNMSQVLLLRPPELTGWEFYFIEKENTFTQTETIANVRVPHILESVGGETGEVINVRRSDQDESVHLDDAPFRISWDILMYIR